MTTTIDHLRGLARHNPAALTPAQKDMLIAAANVDREAKALGTLPFGPAGLAGAEVLRHPSGLLVHGPGSADIIRAAQGRTLGESNSALWATLGSYGRAYKEPPLKLWRGSFMDIEGAEVVENHAIYRLLRQPNPWIRSLRLLSEWQAKVKMAGGDAFFVKIRSGGGDIVSNTTGAVLQLRPLSPLHMEPMARKGSGNPLDYYAFYHGGRDPLEVPIENVIHFRNGCSPKDPVRGISVVKLLANEIATGEQSDLLVRAVLTNLGVPGIVVSPKGDVEIDDPEELKNDITSRTTGDRRGEAIVITVPADVAQFQSNLEVLKLGDIWRHVESRISGVVGWPAILAGLEAGLEHATYSNAETLQEFATEQTLISVWLDDSETWTNGLGADFGLRDDEFLAYDWTAVRALQEDEDKRWDRALKAWDSFVLTLGEFAEMVGRPLPEGADPSWRKADLQGFSLGALTRAGKGRMFVIPSRRRGPGLLPMSKGEKFVPESTTRAKLEVGDPEDYADDAEEDFNAWIENFDADLVGILDAE